MEFLLRLVICNLLWWAVPMAIKPSDPINSSSTSSAVVSRNLNPQQLQHLRTMYGLHRRHRNKVQSSSDKINQYILLKNDYNRNNSDSKPERKMRQKTEVKINSDCSKRQTYEDFLVAGHNKTRQSKKRLRRKEKQPKLLKIPKPFRVTRHPYDRFAVVKLYPKAILVGVAVIKSFYILVKQHFRKAGKTLTKSTDYAQGSLFPGVNSAINSGNNNLNGPLRGSIRGSVNLNSGRASSNQNDGINGRNNGGLPSKTGGSNTVGSSTNSGIANFQNFIYNGPQTPKQQPVSNANTRVYRGAEIPELNNKIYKRHLRHGTPRQTRVHINERTIRLPQGPGHRQRTFNPLGNRMPNKNGWKPPHQILNNKIYQKAVIQGGNINNGENRPRIIQGGNIVTEVGESTGISKEKQEINFEGSFRRSQVNLVGSGDDKIEVDSETQSRPPKNQQHQNNQNKVLFQERNENVFAFQGSNLGNQKTVVQNLDVPVQGNTNGFVQRADAENKSDNDVLQGANLVSRPGAGNAVAVNQLKMERINNEIILTIDPSGKRRYDLKHAINGVNLNSVQNIVSGLQGGNGVNKITPGYISSKDTGRVSFVNQGITFENSQIQRGNSITGIQGGSQNFETQYVNNRIQNSKNSPIQAGQGDKLNFKNQYGNNGIQSNNRNPPGPVAEFENNQIQGKNSMAGVQNLNFANHAVHSNVGIQGGNPNSEVQGTFQNSLIREGDGIGGNAIQGGNNNIGFQMGINQGTGLPTATFNSQQIQTAGNGMDNIHDHNLNFGTQSALQGGTQNFGIQNTNSKSSQIHGYMDVNGVHVANKHLGSQLVNGIQGASRNKLGPSEGYVSARDSISYSNNKGLQGKNLINEGMPEQHSQNSLQGEDLDGSIRGGNTNNGFNDGDNRIRGGNNYGGIQGSNKNNGIQTNNGQNQEIRIQESNAGSKYSESIGDTIKNVVISGGTVKASVIRGGLNYKQNLIHSGNFTVSSIHSSNANSEGGGIQKENKYSGKYMNFREKLRDTTNGPERENGPDQTNGKKNTSQKVVLGEGIHSGNLDRPPGGLNRNNDTLSIDVVAYVERLKAQFLNIIERIFESEEFESFERVALIGINLLGILFDWNTLQKAKSCLDSHYINTRLCSEGIDECVEEYEICEGRNPLMEYLNAVIQVPLSVFCIVIIMVFPQFYPLLALFQLFIIYIVSRFQSNEIIANFDHYLPMTVTERREHLTFGGSLYGLGIDDHLITVREQAKFNGHILHDMDHFLHHPEYEDLFWATFRPAHNTLLRVKPIWHEDNCEARAAIDSRYNHIVQGAYRLSTFLGQLLETLDLKVKGIFQDLTIGPCEDNELVFDHPPYLDNYVDVSAGTFDFRTFSRWSPNPHEFTGHYKHSKFDSESFICRPAVTIGANWKENYPWLAGPSHKCINALGYKSHNRPAERFALFDLGDGKDTAIGFDGLRNFFHVESGQKKYIGGAKNDYFCLEGDAMTSGLLSGGEGIDTLEITGDDDNIVNILADKLFNSPLTDILGTLGSGVINLFKPQSTLSMPPATTSPTPPANTTPTPQATTTPIPQVTTMPTSPATTTPTPPAITTPTPPDATAPSPPARSVASRSTKTMTFFSKPTSLASFPGLRLDSIEIILGRAGAPERIRSACGVIRIDGQGGSRDSPDILEIGMRNTCPEESPREIRVDVPGNTIVRNYNQDPSMTYNYYLKTEDDRSGRLFHQKCTGCGCRHIFGLSSNLPTNLLNAGLGLLNSLSALSLMGQNGGAGTTETSTPATSTPATSTPPTSTQANGSSTIGISIEGNFAIPNTALHVIYMLTPVSALKRINYRIFDKTFHFEIGTSSTQSTLELSTSSNAHVRTVDEAELNIVGQHPGELVFNFNLSNSKFPFVVGSKDFVNIFNITNSYLTVTGGDMNDMFTIGPGARVGSINGGSSGSNTIVMDKGMQDKSMFDLANKLVTFPGSSEPTRLFGTFQNVMGRVNVGDALVTCCDTKIVDLKNGGLMDMDQILIPKQKIGCNTPIVMVVQVLPYTNVTNKNTDRGQFYYNVRRPDATARSIHPRGERLLDLTESNNSYHIIQFEYNPQDFTYLTFDPNTRIVRAITDDLDLSVTLSLLASTETPSGTFNLKEDYVSIILNNEHIREDEDWRENRRIDPVFKFKLNFPPDSRTQIIGGKFNSNHFYINNQYKFIEGGPKEDVFIMETNGRVGTINGGGGHDILLLKNSFQYQKRNTAPVHEVSLDASCKGSFRYVVPSTEGQHLVRLANAKINSNLNSNPFQRMARVSVYDFMQLKDTMASRAELNANEKGEKQDFTLFFELLSDLQDIENIVAHAHTSSVLITFTDNHKSSFTVLHLYTPKDPFSAFPRKNLNSNSHKRSPTHLFTFVTKDDYEITTDPLGTITAEKKFKNEQVISNTRQDVLNIIDGNVGIANHLGITLLVTIVTGEGQILKRIQIEGSDKMNYMTNQWPVETHLVGNSHSNVFSIAPTFRQNKIPIYVYLGNDKDQAVGLLESVFGEYERGEGRLNIIDFSNFYNERPIAVDIAEYKVHYLVPRVKQVGDDLVIIVSCRNPKPSFKQRRMEEETVVFVNGTRQYKRMFVKMHSSLSEFHPLPFALPHGSQKFNFGATREPPSWELRPRQINSKLKSNDKSEVESQDPSQIQSHTQDFDSEESRETVSDSQPESDEDAQPLLPLPFQSTFSYQNRISVPIVMGKKSKYPVSVVQYFKFNFFKESLPLKLTTDDI